MEDARQRLYEQICEWNESRLDLFALSEPNLDLEFFGVMRFYFQDDRQGNGEKVSTKCVRVSSTASARDVLSTLIEKFRPDMRMLTASQFALFEMHSDCEERRLQDWECPLLVQLNWGKDDREGRIVMKRIASLSSAQAIDYNDNLKSTTSFNRKLSKREKKELKKQEKEGKPKSGVDGSVTLYHEMPESVLTRSISNPEMVMRRRRQAKLEKKLQQIRTSDGGPESGGTLKIYGNTICPEVPYKTLLLSAGDRAEYVVKETLEKYGLEREDPRDYCLVKVTTSYTADGYSDYNSSEYVLNDYDYPLDVLLSSSARDAQITFHLRHRNPKMLRNGGSRPPQRTLAPGSPLLQSPPEHPTHPYTSLPPDQLPLLLEIDEVGNEIQSAQRFTIPINGLEVGCDRLSPPGVSHLLLQGNEVQPRHCAFRYTDTAVILTRLSANAIIVVNGARVFDTILLRHSDSIFLGGGHFLRFIIPSMMKAAASVNVQETYVNQGVTLGLPATIDCREDADDRLISDVLLESSFHIGAFRFVPTYVIYMTLRHMIDNRVPPRRIIGFSSKVCERVHQLVQKSTGEPHALSLWMANASELLQFLSHDMDLKKISAESCERLANSVQMAFFSLVRFLKSDLNQFMPAFLDVRADVGEVPDAELMSIRPPGSGPTVRDAVAMLGDVIGLLLRSHVNAALTIQLFSQLFHHINQWLFNRLVQKTGPGTLCTRDWGHRLVVRLRVVEGWAERQGLELAAACHLSRISQAAHLLRSQKFSSDDITEICAACYRLNSLQLAALLRNYVPGVDEPPRIPPELIERAIMIARNTADETARKEGHEITLLEDSELRLPFLLPEDGYSFEFVKGLPEEIGMFIRPLGEAGLCRLRLGNPDWKLWTVFFNASGLQSLPPAMSHSQSLPGNVSNVPKAELISFRKINNSLGLSIVDAIGEGLTERNIYVKSVVPGGAASVDGRIQAGDLLLEVDGKSLQGLTQEAAAGIMSRSGPVVSLKIVRQGAVYDGLAMLLNQPSPMHSTLTQQAMPGPQPVVDVFSSSPQLNYQPDQSINQNRNSSIEPAGGRYRRLGDTLPGQSKSTSNINEINRGYQVMNPVKNISILKATHNIDNGPVQPKPVNVKPSNGMPKVQYPYMPQQMDNTYHGNTNKLGPQNTDALVVRQQPRTIEVPKQNVSRPYSAYNAVSENPNNPAVYGQPKQYVHASQPDLSRQNSNGVVLRNPRPNISQSQNIYPNGPQSQHMYPNGPARASNVIDSGLPVTNMPSRAYQQQLQQERQSQVVVAHPNQANEWNPPQSSILSRAQPAAGSLHNGYPANGNAAPVRPVQEEPQYARVIPRGPRSQSVPRNTDRNSTGIVLDYSSRSSTISPWTREEREKEMKEKEKAKQRLRDEEIQDLESRIHLSREDLERLKRLQLDADFDRRLDEVSKRKDDEDDTELTAAGRANLLHMMQEDLRQRRAAMDQKFGTDGAFPKPPERKSSYGAFQPDVKMSNGNGGQYGDSRQGVQQPQQQQQQYSQHRQQQQYPQPQYQPGRQPPSQQQQMNRPQQQQYQPQQQPLLYQPQKPQQFNQPQQQQQFNQPIQQYQPQKQQQPQLQKFNQPQQQQQHQPQQTYQTQQQQHYQPQQQYQPQQPKYPVGQPVDKKTVSFNADTNTTRFTTDTTNRGRQGTGYPYKDSTSDFRNSNFGRQSQEIKSQYDPYSMGNGYSRQPSNGPPTPGVVGTQEVYRDPRDRFPRNAQAQQNVMPERMSFRDKMKHFANEAGEDTPGDRVKISRAQRDLEVQMNGR